MKCTADVQMWGDRLSHLMDAEYLREKLRVMSEKELSHELHVAPKTLRKALCYHGIVVAPRRLIQKNSI